MMPRGELDAWTAGRELLSATLLTQPPLSAIFSEKKSCLRPQAINRDNNDDNYFCEAYFVHRIERGYTLGTIY